MGCLFSYICKSNSQNNWESSKMQFKFVHLIANISNSNALRHITSISHDFYLLFTITVRIITRKLSDAVHQLIYYWFYVRCHLISHKKTTKPSTAVRINQHPVITNLKTVNENADARNRRTIKVLKSE